MKTRFDGITLAYSTLSNPVSRSEYDEYISQIHSVSGLYNEDLRNAYEDDPEVLAERERRRKERGKKRFEQDYSFINDEFFSSWQNRTSNSGEKVE